MSRYYPKKPSHTETYHEIITPKNKFLLTIRELPESNRILILIGGIDTYCMECQIFKHTPIANLLRIMYVEKCSLTSRFDGTDIISMVSLLITYIQDTYPHVTTITFDDFSRKECQYTTSIDLAPFYYAFHNETWYMNRMNAYFYDPIEKAMFETKTAQFQASKASMTWEAFDAYVTTEHPLPPAEMIVIYNTSETWLDFFNKLKAALDNDMNILCEYMYPWITTFVHRIAKIRFTDFHFAIPINNSKISRLTYTLMPYGKETHGKYTRKQYKRRKAMDLQ